ncbi:hypothetical protein [Filimonas effusa]|uniref:HNH endonuclease n=1 Tax=Filimonas effusa TaxID=2508721 RepID=A0A4Q1DC10_9BACT|nr:hypothetical protein [Filimonas effusa]RXK87034.1 hypothetical protein ESB13_09690 [Filimonas effusa]
MIKIEHPNLKKIAQEYFLQVKEKCIRRAGYYKKIIEVLFNHGPHADLKDYKLNGKSKTSLANLFLNSASKLTDQHHYANVVIANCYPWVAANRLVFESIANYLDNDKNLEELILCMPDQSILIETKIKNQVGVTAANQAIVTPFINYIIDYRQFDYFAYNIASQLAHNTCPYCNRIYIHTVIDRRKKEIIRPTFDHFFSQKDHPLLALSFYNLIPSCYYCNSSLKGDKSMALATHLHPYMDKFGDDISFHILIKDVHKDKSNPDNYHLFLKNDVPDSHPKYGQTSWAAMPTPNEHRGNINLFRLNEIYQSHLDVVGELIVKCDSLSDAHARSLGSFFNQLHTNRTEFYRFYFGNYFHEKDFHRRPLAKLTKDIIRKTLPHFAKDI